MRAVGVLFLAVLTAGPSVAFAEAAAVSKLQLRALSPKESARRVADQLGDLLIESWRPQSGRCPVRPLRDMYFKTRPRNTDVPGLCATDEVTIRFEPSGQGGQGAATLVRANSIESRTLYRFVVRPVAATANAEMRDRAFEAQRCAALDPLNQTFFDAPDPTTAVEAIWRLDALVRSARAAGQDFTTPCQLNVFDRKLTCRQVVAAFATDEVSSIDRCEGVRTDCWVVEANLYVMRIEAGASGVAQIKVSEELIIADERID